MLAKVKPTTAATTTKTAVHVAWADTAFKPIEVPSIPEPAMKVQSKNGILVSKLSSGKLNFIHLEMGYTHTKAECGAKYFTSDTTKHQSTSIVDTIDLGVA